MAGIIKHHLTSMKIKIDDNIMPDGFENIKTQRIYVASDIRIQSHQVSPLSIITSNRSNIENNMVKRALEMAQCDFITESNLSDINVKLSKGQINRLKVARYMYDILTEKSSVVFLDEIADGVDPSSTIKIANSIFEYFRSEGIICFMTTHLPYLQEMMYDQHIRISGGLITKICS